jgi:hypothetical protein
MTKKPQGRIQDPKFNPSDFGEMISGVGRDDTDEETI